MKMARKLSDYTLYNVIVILNGVKNPNDTEMFRYAQHDKGN